ncbi:histone-lysine N-methyltransferase, H3 lysine-9 specific SUVH4 isoform X3 [Rosa chinensis]|uniref:histone-lysine N-methyltransferase, H3 lysine-9 specific SUVH4 isoform X3 n=1 Tax=Rosa chinensis TaxID=74649 RepID=UPI000D088D5C|nr:histone-lysine N-methyltransferase, H3 lysine-9 specific SUVH4 isoform X3 [Rosa chinensis]
MAAPKDSVLERRVSLRLQYAQQKPFYGTRKRTESEAGPNGVVVSKKPKVKVSSLVRRSSESGTKKLGKHKADDDDEEAGNCESGTEKSENGEVEAEESGDCEGENKSVDVKERDMSVYAPSGAKVDGKGKSYVAKLKETLRLFNLHYLHFVQEEEKRCRKLENESECRDDLKKPSKRVDKKAISENGNGSLGVPKKQSKRPDLKALSQDKFKGYTLPIAVAIVLSGQYEDDVDNSDEIVYTGQGGNDLLGNKRQIQDQVMRMGNLALKNNMEQFVPVRVIRGHKCDTSYTKKVYTYDGLYQVHHYWAEKGVAGFTVFKYRLKRLPGQPKLISNQVLYTNGKGSKAQSELPGLVCKDICNGLENIKVPVTNIVDIPPVAPEGLTYITTTEVAKGVKIPPHAHGCNCQGNCTNSKTCSCAQLNGGDFPYVSKDGGRLVEAKAVVFECGPQCGCGPSCVNRASQRGLKYRLEVFRTHDKGWAVRSWDFIPSGAPVCEYIAVLRRNDEIDNISEKENEYVFEIDCWQTMNGIGGREKRMGNVAIPNSDVISESDPEYCYDAGSRGNVARYINHSCEPNLFVQCVLREHHDVRLARIVLFAADNIPPLQELSYDYGYELDSVVGPDGKIKKLFCRCGAAGCRKRLY